MYRQQLWSLKLDWDGAIPMGLHTRWLQFRQELADLNRILETYLETNKAIVSLHAFSDASGIIYAVVKTIPLLRLELCAAILMARLTDRVTKVLNMDVGSIQHTAIQAIIV
ncbi:unnamed protein product [Hermetia illucens]|uniref:Uncharacterized protein n=1 Tax=Hermetia illucens TaxID=343691 RepID=A0A7R8UFN5_HERIL|nr:unnamed protein product [Hermetia illucens]